MAGGAHGTARVATQIFRSEVSSENALVDAKSGYRKRISRTILGIKGRRGFVITAWSVAYAKAVANSKKRKTIVLKHG